MKQRLTLIVERSSGELGKHIKMFDKVVDTDSSVTIPFEKITDSLRFIFGHECIISFSMSLYGSN